MKKFKLGFLINPIAGIGGRVALKGSDGQLEEALSRGAKPLANHRAALTLEVLKPYINTIEIYTVNGVMGADCAIESGFNTHIVYHNQTHGIEKTTIQDTRNAITALIEQQVDIIVFAGGDGTARDICQIISQQSSQIPVLGIPAGCKIHSGVYAITPKAAGHVIELMLTNQLVSLMSADVMDIDEELFRQGAVKAKRYGEMVIPSELRYIQAVKAGGKESDELVLQDISADIIDKMDDELFIIGSGSTTEFLMEELGLTNTLLGVDVVQNHTLLASDTTEQQLWEMLQQYSCKPHQPCKLVITLIGGQGHLFGRGNQQLSPRIIRFIGKENIYVIATKSKLLALQDKPLVVDTGDNLLDQSFEGFIPVITGYNDQVLYPVMSM